MDGRRTVFAALNKLSGGASRPHRLGLGSGGHGTLKYLASIVREHHRPPVPTSLWPALALGRPEVQLQALWSRPDLARWTRTDWRSALTRRAIQ